VNIDDLRIRYDKSADVLYLTFGKARSGISVEVNDGDLVRIDPFTDKIIGITIIDFKSRYLKKDEELEQSAMNAIPRILKKFEHIHN